MKHQTPVGRDSVHLRRRRRPFQREQDGSRKSNKCNSTKVLKVDQLLDLHEDEPSISASAPRIKWVLDIPIPETKHMSNGQKKKERLCNKKVSIYDFAMKRNRNKNQKQAAIKVTGRSVSERVLDKPPTLKDLFAEQSRSNFNSPPPATKSQTIEYQEDTLNSSLTEDNQDSSLSPPDSCSDGLEQVDNEDEFYATPMVQAVEDTVQCSDSCMIKIRSPKNEKTNHAYIKWCCKSRWRPETIHPTVWLVESDHKQFRSERLSEKEEWKKKGLWDWVRVNEE
ncbi:hypothetical protein REPUB_Repub11eG0084800 [Reevesia pubescens]